MSRNLQRTSSLLYYCKVSRSQNISLYNNSTYTYYKIWIVTQVGHNQQVNFIDFLKFGANKNEFLN